MMTCDECARIPARLPKDALKDGDMLGEMGGVSGMSMGFSTPAADEIFGELSDVEIFGELAPCDRDRVRGRGASIDDFEVFRASCARTSDWTRAAAAESSSREGGPLSWSAESKS
eukprot:TRINITY_DN10414_c0_g1_i2.p1 TRINITY_DN10414_c0_g1~~TRINITY_DN10414_c0_g1_i2.p1  ORF type:complete len:115 (-),score=21.24 TRINITY_DN10414_c0_g1_i2:217-561(-)